MKRLLSIVIPSNNKSFLLHQAIASIIGDPGWNNAVEICISDNSSDEETLALIEKHYGDYDQVRYRRSLDAPSLDENVNMALSMSNAKYAWIFGDDDLIGEGFLSELILYLTEKNPDIAIINSSSFSEEGVVEQCRLILEEPKVYGAEDNDQFLKDLGAYVTYVPSIIIKPDLWRSNIDTQKFGSFFAHIDALYKAKVDHVAHWIAKPGIQMRLHHQTWTSKHFEIWNIFFPSVIWNLHGYSDEAKASVIPYAPLKSLSRIIASRAYGRFNLTIYREFLIHSKDSSSIVKCLSFLIALLPREIFRLLYIFYIKKFRSTHTRSFSPNLALAQLVSRKNR